MYVRRFPASSTEIDDLKKEIEDLRDLVLKLSDTVSQAQTNDSNDD